tara:strand:+ start:290 stop:751 length:462 start_codon:yes stop_codon:yes gene_type:complete
LTFHDLRCRLKPYCETVVDTFMVEIECPHCDEDIELDDDDFGLFECPYCEEEFEWESDDEFERVVVDGSSILSREIFRVALIVCVIGFFVSLILVAYFANMDDDTPSEDAVYGAHPGFNGAEGTCGAYLFAACALIFLFASLFPFIGFWFRRG